MFGDKLVPEEIQNRFQRIYSNIKYLEDGIQNIVVSQNLEQLEAFQAEGEILLPNIVEEIVSNWQTSKQEIRLAIDLDDTMQLSPWNIRTVRRLLDNLISNAVKYSDEVIKILLHSKDDKILIKIMDNGRGIDKADIPQVSKIMYRGSNTQDKKGMGLGLYTVQQIVQALKGQVHIESELDNGTTVILTLPYTAPTKT